MVVKNAAFEQLDFDLSVQRSKPSHVDRIPDDHVQAPLWLSQTRELSGMSFSICRMTEEKSAVGSSLNAAEFAWNAAAVVGKVMFAALAASSISR